jgi:membrane protein
VATRETHRAAIGLLRRVAAGLDRLGRDNVTGASGQFAYNAFLATVPFLAVCLAIVGIAGSPDTIERVIDSFGASLPPQVADQLNQALVAATRNNNTTALVLVVGGALGLYVTSGAIGALVRCLEDIEGRPHRSWYESRLANLAIAVAAIVLVLVTSAALIGGPRLIDAIADSAQLGSGFRGLAKDIIYPIGVAGIVVFTLILYRFGPSGPRRHVRDTLPGAVVAVAGWVGASQLFNLYVDRFGRYDKVYGSLGAVVVYLIFLYLTGFVLLIGGEVNEAWRQWRLRRHKRG